MVIVLDFYYQSVPIVSSSIECKVGSRPGQTGSQVSIAQLANKCVVLLSDRLHDSQAMLVLETLADTFHRIQRLVAVLLDQVCIHFSEKFVYYEIECDKNVQLDSSDSVNSKEVFPQPFSPAQ